MNASAPLVIFLHIPKTAGTTLHLIMAQQYDPWVVYHFANNRPSKAIHDFRALPQTRQEGMTALYGHVPFGLHEHLDRPCKYITILRDPVERIISNYYFVLRRERHFAHQGVRDGQMSLKDFVTSNIVPRMDNTMTRMLAGARRIPFGECPPELLEEAQANLRDHFALVGLTERFDETLMLLRSMLGWPEPYYARFNVTPNRPRQAEIPADTLSAIEEINHLDVELYRHVQQLFEEKISQMDGFDRQLQAFKARNQRYGKLFFSFRRTLARGKKLFYRITRDYE